MKRNGLLMMLLTVLAVAMLFAANTPTANAATEVASGDCGKNLTWTLDDTGTLTISGTGDMTDWSYDGGPWYSYYRSIKSVVIKDGVTSIGKYAFYACTALTSVTIPDSVTIIDDYAFDCCFKLTSITIPNGVRIIGACTFSSCSKLTSVIIPDTVDSIGRSAFYYCTSLPAIVIPYGVTNIGSFAFEDCYNLEKVTIPNSVTSVGSDVFADTAWFENQPDGLVYVGKVAHKYKGVCSGEVAIQDGTVSISSWAFDNCTGLVTVRIPASVTVIDNYAFNNCKDLKGIWVHADNPSYSNDAQGCLFNKDQTVFVQAPGAMSGSYKLPNTVTTIGIQAFRNCDNLTTVVIPDGVTTIGSFAFGNCSNLTSAIIPDSVISISGGAFSQCKNLTTMIIPDHVKSIGYSAFHNCTSLTSVTVGKNVASIDYSAFNSCASLQKITFTGNAPLLGNNMFYNVTATAYYPAGDPTWTQEVRKDYGGTITWIPYEVTETEKFELMGANLTMGNDLDLQFAVASSMMEDWTGCYFELVRSYADGTVDDVKTVPIAQQTSGAIIVKYEGLAAKEMGDKICVTIYNADGQAISQTWEDSVAEYAVRMLRKATLNSQKQLIVDMLVYGAQAQSYLGYDTENPVTNLLTADELALATQNVTLEATLDRGSYWKGSNLTIKSNIVFQIAMQNVTEGMTLSATYTDHTGKAHTLDTYTTSGALKILVFDQMVIADARQVITVTVTDASGKVVSTCQESIAEYLARQANAHQVFKAVMAFSDSAYAYLHRNDA